MRNILEKTISCITIFYHSSKYSCVNSPSIIITTELLIVMILDDPEE